MSLMTKARELLTGNTEQQRASLADRLAAARTELETVTADIGRLALASEEGDEPARKRLEQSREHVAKLRERFEHLRAATVAHEARAAAEAARVKAANREIFETEGRAALADVKAAGVAVDLRMVALADVLVDFAEACEKARPYLNDEGNSALYRATLALDKCLKYKLRGLPGFMGNRDLTNERLETWAQHVPGVDDAQRLIAKEG